MTKKQRHIMAELTKTAKIPWNTASA